MNTSPKASVAAAFRAEELILLPTNLLKADSQTLKLIEINKRIKGIKLLL